MKASISIILVLVVVGLTAQTRRIAHRFHSGADHKRYDGNSGNYGIPMPHTTNLNGNLIVFDSVVHDDGTIYYRWDTIDYSPPAHINSVQPKRVARMRDLGNICTTLTVR